VVSPAIRVVLENLALEIRFDAGRQGAQVLLAILGAGPESVRQYINELDAILGADSPGIAGLEELVRVTEQAVDGARPTVPKQHFLSQVVQRRWQEPVPGLGKVLRSYDLRTGVEDHGTTEELGMVEHFVQVDSKATEDLWWVVENEFNRAVNPVLAGQPPSAKQLDTLKACVALHYIRNPQIVKGHQDGFAAAVEQQTERLIRVGYASLVYYREHGIWPAGPEAYQEGVDLVQKRMTDLQASGGLFRLSIQRLYEKVRDEWFASMNIELVVPVSSSKEFLIGDVPALTVNTTTGTAGVRNGVAIGNADLIFMPLAPKLAAIVGGGTGVHTANDQECDDLNRYQVIGASHYVYYRPGANFAPSIASWRP
jgi:hypothetical protein